MAARRHRLVEPIGPWPSPWATLAATLGGGGSIDGELGWTEILVHVPVYDRRGAVDFRLRARFNGEAFIALDPELILRALPFRPARGQGAMGLAFTMLPSVAGDEPTMTLGGGLLGGYLAERWFVRGYVGLRGDVIQGRAVELLGHLAVGLRLPHGFRPQVELDVVGEAIRRGEITVAVRPALRYWPLEWLGIGIAGDIWAFGPGIAASTLRIDLVFQALE